MSEINLSINIGIDIVEIERIEQAVSSYHDSFLHRIYTNTELAYCNNRPSRLAARFAAKEAVLKMLGTGIQGANLKEIEIISTSEGKPIVQLYGKIKNKATIQRITELSVSLSHEKKYAIACVIGNVN
jgi:holo-[acyl-carrier protein] synthase